MNGRVLTVALLVVAFVAGCGGSQPPEHITNQTGSGSAGAVEGGSGPGAGSSTTSSTADANSTDANSIDDKTPGEGQVCAYGARSAMVGKQAPKCPTGLQCCYPCGIDGCDSVCIKDCGPPRP